MVNDFANTETLDGICGKHIFYGCEQIFEEPARVIINLSGTNYEFIENKNEDYRSYCEFIGVTDYEPKYKISEGVFVTVKKCEHEKIEGIEIFDCETKEIILTIATNYTEDYYPVCVFEYTPENMAINK